MKENNREQDETHKFLPSGEWEGFYCYKNSSQQYKMESHLNFKKGTISGSGNDDVGAFTWHGVYNLDNYKVEMVKHYASHNVLYNGDIDENGIWGLWKISDYSSGGFHIWPKKSERASEEHEAEESIRESLKLREFMKN